MPATDPETIFGTVPEDNLQDHPNTIILNDQKYWLQVFFDDGENVKQIPNAFINDIEIKESLMHWETYVFVEYQDPYGLFTNLYNAAGKTLGCDAIEKSNYRFKGNNKEKLHIKFLPLPDGNNSLSLSEFKPSVWHIQMDLIISGVANLGMGDDGSHIKLYCVDYQWNELKSKKMEEWNCGLEGGNKYRNEIIEPTEDLPNPSGIENLKSYPTKKQKQAKALKTGEGVYTCLKNAELTDHLPMIDEGRSREEKRLVLDESALQGEDGETLQPYEVWDFGAEEHRVFLSPNSDWVRLDFMEYFLYWHGSGEIAETSSGDGTSSDSNLPSLDPCFLTLERPQSENAIRKYNLKSLKHYFENAGEDEPGKYHRENFFLIQGEGLSINKALSIIRSPLQKACGENKNIGILTKDNTTVRNHRAQNTDGSDSRDYIRNHVVQWYNYEEKTHVNSLSTVEQIETYITDNYLKYMFAQDKSKDSVMLGLNKDKKEIKDEKLVMSIPIQTKYAATIAGRNKMLLAAILLNRCLDWKVSGSTNRQVGRFCGIDRYDSTEDSDADNAVLGQYFLINCTHKIELKKKQYSNDLTGVKFFSFAPPKQADPEGD